MSDTPSNALQLARSLQARGYRVSLKPLTRDTWQVQIGASRELSRTWNITATTDVFGLVETIDRELQKLSLR